MPKGDPRNQQRPDGRDTDEVTRAFPPNLSLVVTEIGATVVPFTFPGGKAIDLTIFSGDLQVHAHIPVQTAEIVIEAIREAKMKAETGIVTAQAMPNGNGHA